MKWVPGSVGDIGGVMLWAAVVRNFPAPWWRMDDHIPWSMTWGDQEHWARLEFSGWWHSSQCPPPTSDAYATGNIVITRTLEARDDGQFTADAGAPPARVGHCNGLRYPDEEKRTNSAIDNYGGYDTNEEDNAVCIVWPQPSASSAYDECDQESPWMDESSL